MADQVQLMSSLYLPTAADQEAADLTREAQFSIWQFTLLARWKQA